MTYLFIVIHRAPEIIFDKEDKIVMTGETFAEVSVKRLEMAIKDMNGTKAVENDGPFRQKYTQCIKLQQILSKWKSDDSTAQPRTIINKT